MAKPSPHEVTELLQAWSDGRPEALDRLVPLIYQDLHRLARRYMRGERPDHALQTTELINEAYIRLADWKTVRWQNRAHFFGVVAQMMRRVLVDFARSRKYAKRGGEARRVSLSEALVRSQEQDADLIALDDALERLTALDPRKSQIVELRFFGGLSVEQTAEVLKVSNRTVIRDWRLAQAWLYRELNKNAQ